MKPRDLGDLVLLAALWGGSFLFMRIAAPEFGAVALSGLRVAGAALVLVPLLLLRGHAPALRAHWKAIAVVGVLNSALPFMLFSHAVLSLSAGLSSLLNSAAPLFAALVGAVWLRQAPGASRTLGLLIGFAGVFGLAWSRAGLSTGGAPLQDALAIGACLAATLSYGFAANFTQHRLSGVPPLAVAAGSQLAAAVVLAAPTAGYWPAAMPGPRAWLALALLAVLCTGFAYLLFFRLIARIGPGSAISVTFLVPAFAMAWGALVLGEQVTPAMLAAAVVILSGTALATGLLRLPLVRLP